MLVSLTARNSISSIHFGPQPLKWSGKRSATNPIAGSNWVDLVGARAGRVLRQPGFGVVAALLVLLHQRRVDDMNLRYDREENRRRLRQLELDGVVVDRLGGAGIDHGLEQRGCALADGENALQRVDDVLRLHFGAVVELDALAHHEGVGEPVRRDRVAFRDPRFEHRGIVLPAHQAVIDIEPDGDAADVERGVRIGCVVVAFVGEDEAAGRGVGRQRDAEPAAAAGPRRHRPSIRAAKDPRMSL